MHFIYTLQAANFAHVLGLYHSIDVQYLYHAGKYASNSWIWSIFSNFQVTKA